MPRVLISAASTDGELRAKLVEAGHSVLDHVLGSTPPVDFTDIAVAVIDVGPRSDVSVSQTVRWRAELGEEIVPIVWVLPAADSHLSVRGLEAGADVVLVQPLDQTVLLAQIRSAARTHGVAARASARASESRLLGGHLQKALSQMDRDLAAVRRLQRALLPGELPEVGQARFTVSHRARARVGGDFYDVRLIGASSAGFFLADVLGTGTAAGLLGVFAAQSIAMRPGTSPGESLGRVNRELMALMPDDRPLVAMLVGTLDGHTGSLALARAGLPAPIYLPAGGRAESWAVPGPFLGTAETSYPTHTARLRSGDRLILGTDGIRPDGNPHPSGDGPLLELVERHRDLNGQAFGDALARDLLAQVLHEDDFTLLVVEMK